MKTRAFDYNLPAHLIAQQPSDRRDGSRMMVVDRAEGRWEHRAFTDLPAYLGSGDVVVFNNTRVIPARLMGRKPQTGGKVEVFLLEARADEAWDVLLRSRRRPVPGETIVFGDGELVATMVADGEKGRAVVRFSGTCPVLAWASAHGEVPLPPYIRREGEASVAADRDRYQTVYARHPGAVAAPTAGLHFTPEMLAHLDKLGVARADVTLHVGIGTFRPVEVDDVEAHRMEEERYVFDREAAATILAAKACGGKCLAVGSTSVRTLEAVAARHGTLIADEGRTGLFIYPPYTFRIVDRMLTNFHLPQSTLLMMISALAGYDLIRAAYDDAVKNDYRFFSYGDCMLIL